MNQALILMGDTSTHGGTVITCSPASSCDGKGWARVGDLVACPRCKGVFPIIQGDPGLIDEGKEVAYHGCEVACGARLIASQVLITTEPTGGATAGKPHKSLIDGFGDIGAGRMARYQEAPPAEAAREHDETLSETPRHYSGRFQLLDATTGEPIAGQAVRLRSTGGTDLTGRTDAAGFTPWVERDSNEALAFELIEPEHP